MSSVKSIPSPELMRYWHSCWEQKYSQSKTPIVDSGKFPSPNNHACSPPSTQLWDDTASKFCVVARNLSTTAEIHPELHRKCIKKQHFSKGTSATHTTASLPMANRPLPSRKQHLRTFFLIPRDYCSISKSITLAETVNYE